MLFGFNLFKKEKERHTALLLLESYDEGFLTLWSSKDQSLAFLPQKSNTGSNDEMQDRNLISTTVLRRQGDQHFQLHLCAYQQERQF